jgi:TrmH family RNA methyltransferase
VRRVQAGLLQGLGTLHTEPSIVALAQPPAAVALEDLAVEPGALVLVVAGVADPGNLGALARSAEAAGATAMVSLLGGVSPWHPRALRGSMGSLLRLPVVRGLGAEEAMSLLTERGWRSVGAATRGGRTWRDADWSGPVALWVSGETGEESEALAGLERVTIPMAGGVESLNVTVAASLLLFAAGRTGA